MKTGSTLAELMCRPEIDYYDMAEIDSDRIDIPKEVIDQVIIEIKYDGCIFYASRKTLEKECIIENIAVN